MKVLPSSKAFSYRFVPFFFFRLKTDDGCRYSFGLSKVCSNFSQSTVILDAVKKDFVVGIYIVHIPTAYDMASRDALFLCKKCVEECRRRIKFCWLFCKSV